jgi:hypothetical protein
MASSLVVVRDFDVGGVAVTPDEADAELVVHPNAMLTTAISFHGFQPVCGRSAKRVDRGGGVHHGKLTLRHRTMSAGKPLPIVPFQIASMILSLKSRIIPSLQPQMERIATRYAVEGSPGDTAENAATQTSFCPTEQGKGGGGPKVETAA